MVNYVAEILYLKEMGMKPNYAELARKYNKDWRTIKKIYENGGEVVRKKRKYKSELDDCLPIIESKLQIPGVTLIGIHMFLQDMYKIKTGYDNFKAYCYNHNLKLAKTNSKPHVRYETDPGKQLQVDWKEDLKLTTKNGEILEFNLYAATLGYSRKHYFIISQNKTKEAFFRCTLSVLKQLGGKPKEILTDNMSAIVKVSEGHKRKHPEILQFERDSGIKIILCKVRTPETKGKVESSNRFVSRILAYNNGVENWNDLIRIINLLNVKVNEDICETTNMPPNVLFKKEKEYLTPIENMSLLESYVTNMVQAKVDNTSLVTYHGIKYSVPKEYINKIVQIEADDKLLHIYYSGFLIALHEISTNLINYSKEHYVDVLKTTIKNKPDFDFEKMALENLERLKGIGK